MTLVAGLLRVDFSLDGLASFARAERISSVVMDSVIGPVLKPDLIYHRRG